MPTDAADTYCTVHKQGTATFLARVLGPAGTPITRAEIATLRYSLYLLDDRQPDLRTPVAGHEAIALSVDQVLQTTLETGAIWSRDAAGYNFRHTLGVTDSPAFTIAGRRYLLEYRLAPHNGQPILVRFRIHVI
jgi:hypothetical protein